MSPDELLGKGLRCERRFFPAVFCTAVVVGILAAPSPFWSISDKPIPAKVTEDLPAGAMQAKATTACLECHEARIILQQRLSKGAWTKEVDKMVKWGAVVDANDRDALIDYLSTNFSPDQPAYEPPRTAADRNTSEKSAAKPSK
jgi:hypothetical protein